MRLSLGLTRLATVLLGFPGIMAQTTRHYDLVQLLQASQLITSSAQQTQVCGDTSKRAISTKGIVWLRRVRFAEGTIDIDLRGKNVFLQSFLGIAFHAPDTSSYDVVYFRPFNFRHSDTSRRRWSVQYMTIPDYPWDKLRKEHPLIYENAVTPVPEPDAWLHVTIQLKDGWLSVYVDHSAQASLHVHLLNDRKDGMLALWDDELSGDFANLAITP
jgi:hypothetical protein